MPWNAHQRIAGRPCRAMPRPALDHADRHTLIADGPHRADAEDVARDLLLASARMLDGREIVGLLVADSGDAHPLARVSWPTGIRIIAGPELGAMLADARERSVDLVMLAPEQDVARSLALLEDAGRPPVLVLGDDAHASALCAALRAGGVPSDCIPPGGDPSAVLTRAIYLAGLGRSRAAIAGTPTDTCLREAAREAGELLAHDLANALQAALECVLIEQEQLGERPGSPLADAVTNLEYACRLLHDFLDLMRLDDAALVPRRSLVDLGRMLRKAAAGHCHRVGSMSVDAPDVLCAMLDARLVERVLHNLFGNACRFAGRTGSVGVTASILERQLVVGIGNSGRPIPPEMRHAVFDKHRSSQTGRAGFGLYFCRLVCEAHGGSISITEHPRYPAHFSICLPAVEPPPERSP